MSDSLETTVIAIARKLLRHGHMTKHSVKLTSDPSKVGYRVEIVEKPMSMRRRINWRWGPTESHHQITVPAQWMDRVHAAGLHDLDGLMTLDATPLMAPDGIELYAAVWAVQSAGHYAYSQRGFLARRGDLSYHSASSAESALAGLGRKQKANSRPPNALKVSVDDFCARFAGENFDVTLSDASASGSCDDGIKSWCHSTGLDYSRGKAPVAEILAAFRLKPMREARLAILHAARRAAAAARKRTCRFAETQSARAQIAA